VPRDAYEVQMLYGMAEPERAALRERGLRVRVYAPVGELLPGMAYLVRRLLENTSNTGFLRQTYHEHTELAQLLAAPSPVGAESGRPILPAFTNCPLLDFAQKDVRERFAAAVSACATQVAREIPVVLADRALLRPGDFTWVSPSLAGIENASKHGNPGILHNSPAVAHATLATADEAHQAIRQAHAAQPAFNALGWQARARLLLALGDQLEARRIELAALQVIEVAKPWAEADADVAEAIDFCRYYAARAEIELADEAMLSPAGESNTLTYQGRGVCVVIAPWNFPLAILTGMATASLVAGNTVVLKPAEQSLASGYALFTAMQEAGFPPGAVQFLPGLGEIVGPVLTTHPQVAQVAFTGSHAVGTRILRDTAVLQPGQRQFKRVICELGGKNAIVIDDDADLDEAVAGVAKSAFGFAGQKCSAASRLFVVAGVYDTFVSRLCEHLKLWSVLPATDPACDIPPVIDDEAAARLREVIARPGPGAKLLALGAAQTTAPSRFVPPAIFEVDSPQHRLMQEEFFGPVLAVLRVESFEAALASVAATPYALTGGLYSRSPSHIAMARASFDVGNLYVNRPCTGAVVARQPFGGFGQSGLGTKAGGPGYLRLFADPRAISESTMRHGFTPETA
jgi:RHH-type transcriptional regulator, proline utilization regulon repressor / proline dehydrogenase / delta 1-pyrroline-5-carboxylate dehydrogenase